jgi:DNA polymerase-3 subunit gamma/tau
LAAAPGSLENGRTGTSGVKEAGTAVRKPFEKWNEIINELKKSGRMALYTSLLDTKAVELNERTLGIIFTKEKGFNKMLVSKAENIEVVAEAAAKRVGHEVHIKCIDEDYAQQMEDKPVKNEKPDEFVEKAVKIARRVDVPVDIIDG